MQFGINRYGNKADIDLHTVTWIDLKTVLSEK